MATVMSPLSGVLTLGHRAARGCQGHGPVAGRAVLLEIAVMGLPVAQHHPIPAKECCCSAAEQQEERQGQHFMEELQAQQRELCRLQRCEMLHLLCWRGGIEVRWEI